MDFSHIIKGIHQDKHLQVYSPVVGEFLEYLRQTSKMTMTFQGARYQDDTWQDIDKNVQYLHRFTTTYRRGVISKFYQLEDWYNQAPTPVTMLTLTTYQEGLYSRSVTGKGYSIPQSFTRLKSSWEHLRQALRYYVQDTPWVWIMEPHLSGYPHLHVVYFGDMDMGTQAAVRRLWSRNYVAGSYHKGADFQVRKPDFGLQGISSIRNYLLKYVAKGFTSTGSKFGEGDDWTPGQMVFYALTWKEGWRLFGASKELCKVMRYKKAEDERTEWYRTALLDGNGDEHEIWKAQEVNDDRQPD